MAKRETDKQHQEYIENLIDKHPKLERLKEDNRVAWKCNTEADSKGIWIEVKRRDSPTGIWKTPPWMYKKVLITGNEIISYYIPTKTLLKIMKQKQIKEASHKMSQGFHLSDSEIPIEVRRLV